MRIPQNLFLIALIVICTGGIARAESWRVEQDGTGDFTIIQNAVEAAADGDTILIGPGHYQETHEYDPQVGSVIQVTASWDDSRELHFIGSGRDEVLIGPDSYVGIGPSGFWHENNSSMTVEGISFRYCRKCIVSQGSIEVKNCRFSDTFAGVHIFGSGSETGIVSDCEFFHQRSSGTGVGVHGASQFLIKNCYFEDIDFHLQGVPDAIVTDCEFVGRVGFFTSSNGVFTNNHATISSNKALFIYIGSQVLVKDCVFSVSSTGVDNISIGDPGTYVELTGNIFNGGSYAVFDIVASPTIVGSGNHFFKGDSNYILKIQFWGSPSTGGIDLRNNYWGTDNPYLVGLWIHDGADDPDIGMVVNYEPIADSPLPAEPTTLGGLKAMYRNGGK